MSNIPDILREVEQKESEYLRVLKNDQMIKILRLKRI